MIGQFGVQTKWCLSQACHSSLWYVDRGWNGHVDGGSWRLHCLRRSISTKLIVAPGHHQAHKCNLTNARASASHVADTPTCRQQRVHTGRQAASRQHARPPGSQSIINTGRQLSNHKPGRLVWLRNAGLMLQQLCAALAINSQHQPAGNQVTRRGAVLSRHCRLICDACGQCVDCLSVSDCHLMSVPGI